MVVRDFRLLAGLIVFLLLVGCGEKEEPLVIDDERIVSYHVDQIGETITDDSLSFPFCRTGVPQQLTSGSQQEGSPMYSLNIGSRFELSPRVNFVTTRMIGTKEDNRTDLNDRYIKPYLNVERYNTGAAELEAYVDAEFEYAAERYATIVSLRSRQQLDKLDPSARSSIRYEIQTTGGCGSGDELIIRTDLTYDGYAYTLYAPYDSIWIGGLRATLFNYSF